MHVTHAPPAASDDSEASDPASDLDERYPLRQTVPFPSHSILFGDLIDMHDHERDEEEREAASEEAVSPPPGQILHEGRDLARFPFLGHAFQGLEKLEEVNYREEDDDDEGEEAGEQQHREGGRRRHR